MTDEDHGDLLRRHGLRSTPQRRAILQAFRGSHDEHLSAEEVLSRAAARVPDIGRGTVYATLAELTELGILASVGDPEPVRFETNIAAHDHFRCRLCLRLFDVDLGGGGLLDRPLRGFSIESIAVRAEGTCAECNAYRRGLEAGVAKVLAEPVIDMEAVRDIACARVGSPVGELGLVASADGIVRVAYSEHADFESVCGRAGTRRGPTAARGRLRTFAATIERYFGGFRGIPDDTIDWRLAPGVSQEVLVAVQAIAYSESRSYDRLGGALAAHECGVLLGSNPLPLLIPCHRVTCGSERLATYVGGTAALQTLRALEAETA